MAKTAVKDVNTPAPPPPKQILTRSVEKPPVNIEAGPGGGNTFTFWLASIADTFEPWGRNYFQRDKDLRDFFHTETYLSGAVYSSVISNSQLEWTLDGPEQTTEAVHELLNQANMGKGWSHFTKQLSLDIYSQDNGGFVEIVRLSNSPAAAVIGIKTLDAARCQRTGDLNFPVIYTDNQGGRHKMPWYSVITFEEYPSNIETMYGLQYCAVTRALRAAQILRDYAIYKGEKAGGRFAEAIHVVGGVSSQDLKDVQARAGEEGDNAGLARYLGPLVIGSLDPETNPSVATLDLKSLPDSFNLDQEMKWYIASLALAFGRDYQDFAPLSTGNLGTGQQSETLHKKAMQKASSAFMSMIEQAFNFYGVMPQTVTFEFHEEDLETDQAKADIAETWSTTFKNMAEAGVILPPIARQMLQDEGLLKPEYVEAMGEEDLTPDEPVEGAEKPGSNGRPVAQITEPPEEKMVTTMLRSLKRKSKAFPELAILVEDSMREATLDAKIDGLINVVNELKDEGLQGTVDEALSESVKEIADSTHQTISEAMAQVNATLEETETRMERRFKQRTTDVEAEVMRLIGKEVRKARSEGLHEIIDDRIEGPMKEIANSALKALNEAGDAMRSDSSALLVDMNDSLTVKGREIEEAIEKAQSDFADENERRAKDIKSAMEGLQRALESMREEQKNLKSVEEVAAESDKRVRDVAEGLVMVDSQVIKRDKEGRMLIVRKTFASGAQVDYEVIRDKEGTVKNIRAKQ